MDISLRLDTLGVVELRYLRGRERYRDWPQFQLLGASRQTRVFSYMSREVAEQLHQQILLLEEAIGLDGDDEDDDDEEEEHNFSLDEPEGTISDKPAERDSSTLSPAFAQALKQLNELARQRLGDTATGSNQVSHESGTLPDGVGVESDEDDALEQLQDAFTQMMEVVRELAEEMSTDALKITGRFKCARTNIEFIPRATEKDDDEDEDEEQHILKISPDASLIDLEVELIMVLQLFEEGHARPDDLPAVELQLDVDDFERLHETLDFSLERERRSHRRR
ncbi:MAG TPA: hypothetical protein VHZ51_19825 [Ktedonobacteraceae bacterium]|jgi:hypothetical protein|nr:hypothetical protein [Ktedonobacteraceae bacterium]